MRFFCSRFFWTAVILLSIATVVNAEQLAVIADTGETIELHDRVHGKCPPGIKEALYVWPDGHKLEGCWKYISNRDAIYVVFKDGDAFLIPTEKWTWRRGMKPTAL